MLMGVEYFCNQTQETHSDGYLQGQGGWRHKYKMKMKDSPLLLLSTAYMLNVCMFSLLKTNTLESKKCNVKHIFKFW